MQFVELSEYIGIKKIHTLNPSDIVQNYFKMIYKNLIYFSINI